MFSLFPSRTVAVELFGFPIHWYGLLYLFSFLIAWYLLPKLQKWRGLSLTNDEWSSVLTAGVLGVLIGGRLGFVLFYEPMMLWMAPWRVFAVWEGGMASHGGFLGVAIALLIVTRANMDRLLRILDVAAVPIAIGLALGRVGNVINQELYGSVTSLPWGITIPGVEGPRHPTHAYAVIKDLFLASVSYLHLRRSSRPGTTIAFMIMLYSVLRFLNEYLRIQPYGYTEVLGLAFTRGQLLTIPLFVAGALLMIYALKRRG